MAAPVPNALTTPSVPPLPHRTATGRHRSTLWVFPRFSKIAMCHGFLGWNQTRRCFPAGCQLTALLLLNPGAPLGGPPAGDPCAHGASPVRQAQRCRDTDPRAVKGYGNTTVNKTYALRQTSNIKFPSVAEFPALIIICTSSAKALEIF